MLEKDVIKEKNFIEMVGSDKGKLVFIDIGMIVIDFLVEYFKNIVDYNFIVKVEEDFDEIVEGKEEWIKMMKDFYKKFYL